MIKAEEIIDKIWAEHDHHKDDNYVYTDGWTDACGFTIHRLKICILMLRRN